ncbi:MAG: hypothetical protein BGN96_05715 [Bacteroidales bacterium 45-6]|nr:MAG: hypothetical protein BGN96_05715 [Bacteroidales bacterium 45-6]
MVVIKTVFIEPDNIKKQILMSNISYKKKTKVALLNFLFMSYCKQYSFFKEEKKENRRKKYRMKHVVILLLNLVVVSAAFSQDMRPKKFFLSVGGGVSFPIGSSNTHLDKDYTVPFSSGYQMDFDASWYLTKNYGVGVKYRFLKSGQNVESISTLNGILYDDKYPIRKWQQDTFDETIHFVGPAVYGSWQLGRSKWTVQSSLGIGYVSDKLYNLNKKTTHFVDTQDPILIDTDKLVKDTRIKYEVPVEGMVGLSVSTGIHYQATPLIGIGVNSEGLFANLSKEYEGIT